MTRFITNNKGISLIEVLATLSILLIVSGIIFSVFFTTIKSTDTVESQHKVRTELIYVVEKVNDVMKNKNEIKNIQKNASGEIISFDIVTVEGRSLTNTDGIKSTVTIKKVGDSLILGTTKINSEYIDMTRTQFIEKGAVSTKSIDIKFIASDKKTNKNSLEIFVSY